MSFGQDLVRNTEAVMHRIYHFVGLDGESAKFPSQLNVQPEDVMDLVVSQASLLHTESVHFNL